MSQKDCAADEPHVPVEATVYSLYEGRERLGHFIELATAFYAFTQDGRPLGSFRKARKAAQAVAAKATKR